MLTGTVESSSSRRNLRILIIDDEEDWREEIGTTAQCLGYTPEYAASWEEAVSKIKEAEQNGNFISVATIDMKFEMARQHKVPSGRYVLQFIKSQYPYIACIIVSGSEDLDEIVGLIRGEHDPDYYIRKSRFGIDSLADAIDKARRRVRSLGHAPPTINLASLRHLLIERFDEEELRDLCFDLHIDYQSLPAEGKAGKTRELVTFCDRHGRIAELANRCRQLRPNATWGELFEAEP